ncbi:heavy metal-responsive transcriptional regulator [Novipirellula rosea]|uniref:Heavy metal-responsive transcriptional regulator n=1 Tax=Novipirellula rosea TaxID=1031540 RepID=A0ABP8MLD0_9BACT
MRFQFFFQEAIVSDQFTISQLAKSAGIRTSTVRYYERIGLVEPEERSRGNYRLYSDASLDRLKFIRAAQATGFTLDDVKALLLDDAGGTPTCGSVRGLIEDRLADTERRLKDLRHVRRILKSALQQCEQQKKSDCCHVVAGLHRD